MRAKEDRRLSVLIRAAYETGRRYYGSPRIFRELKDQGVHVGRKRIVRLMQNQGLKARIKKRYRLTTSNEPPHVIAPNLLNREFDVGAPNRRWVGDTTELIIGGSAKLYLAVVVDLFSRFAVGWAVSPSNDRHLVIRAFDMAVKRRCPDAGLMHHSDQGSTYTSEDYQKVLEGRGITCSMSRRGNCWDNAVMESWFATLKAELGERFESFGEAKEELFDYIEVFYNQKRRHSTLDYLSPAEYERQRLRSAA